MSRDGAVHVVQLCSHPVSSIVAAHGQFFVGQDKKSLFKSGLPLAGLDNVDERARDRLPEIDQAIRFICYFMLQKLSELASSNSLHTTHEEPKQLQKYRLQKLCLTLVFERLPDSIINALKVA